MSNLEQRAYIKIRTALKAIAKSIHVDLVAVLGKDAYSLTNVYKWIDNFRTGQTSLEDQHRSGRPIAETYQANIDQVERLFDDDPHVLYTYLEEHTSMSREVLQVIIRAIYAFQNFH